MTDYKFIDPMIGMRYASVDKSGLRTKPWRAGIQGKPGRLFYAKKSAQNYVHKIVEKKWGLKLQEIR
jgi:hypothetical protein